MNKLFVIIGLIFILSACSLGQKDTTKQDNIETTNTSSEGPTTVRESTYEQDLKEASSKIKDSEEFKSCMDMNVPMCIQNAGMQLAQKNQSTEFCNELSTPEQKESCIFAVTIVKLQESNDIKLCDPLTGIYKEQCIKTSTRSEAVSKNDIKICSKLAQNTGSGELILIEDSSVDECIMNVIISNAATTIESCNSIQSTQVKEMCTMTMRSRDQIQNIDTPTQN